MAKSKAKTKYGWQVGESYLIRCVTLYYTGRLVAITEQELILDDAAWIASTGRFTTALQTGVLDEVEPFTGPVIIPRGSVVDATTWTHALPRNQK